MFAASKSGQSVVAATDPYFKYVPLLLETTSTNGQQNNTFLDSSTNNFTITRNGTPTQGSVTPYWPDGYWSNYFNGGTNYISAPTNAAFNIGTGDYTFECWIYKQTSTRVMLVSIASAGLSIAINTSGNIEVCRSLTAIDFTFTAGILNNTWSHIAVSRSGTSLRAFLNGTLLGTQTSSTIYGQGVCYVGIDADATSTPYVGYLSNFRIVKGTAVYTSTFTPPTTPLTAITNTSLLTCQSNRFLDNSANAFAITANGTPKVQAFQPFSPPASYTAAAYGGSGYFNGSTDYLSVADNVALQLGTGDFTIEGWFYISGATSTAYNLISKGAAATGWSLNTTTSARIQFSYSALNVTGATTTLVQGSWYHIAVVRSGTSIGNLKIYINGVQEVSSTVAVVDNFNQTDLLYISASRTATAPLNGYSSNIRVVKGTAVYTAAFTPPTAPVTAITNTSLLTNFTNAGIYDAAVQNNAITVGSAQASTTVAKWSPTSMKFNGAGDIISAPANQGFVFNGNLTIEGWVWIDSTMVSSRPDNLKSFIFTGWNTGNTPQFFCYGTTTTAGIGLGYYDGTNSYQVAATVPKDQWVYIAFVRNGTTIYGYVNGTQYTITTAYSSVIGSLNSFVIGGNPNQVSAYYSYLKGYIQDLRITNGVARTITTPTAAFPTR